MTRNDQTGSYLKADITSNYEVTCALHGPGGLSFYCILVIHSCKQLQNWFEKKISITLVRGESPGITFKSLIFFLNIALGEILPTLTK